MKRSKIIIILLMVLIVITLINVLIKVPEHKLQAKLGEDGVVSYVESGSCEPCDKYPLKAIVKGSIYEDNETITIFGSCVDTYNHPKASDVELSILYPNSSYYIKNVNMSILSEGEYNYSTTIPAVKGTYLIRFNCTAGSDWAIAYGELQNPSWLDKLKSVFGYTKGFKIELETGSPVYANGEIEVEVTFTSLNGTIIEPSSIYMVIYDPNDALYDSATKTDFTLEADGIYAYSKSVSSSPTTGMYSVRVNATYNGINSISKTKQFRIATGGPYALYLTCPDNVRLGDNFYCTVKIKDEGEAPTESTTTVWLDTDNDEVVDANEPQTSFSKQTVPQQNVSESVKLFVPGNHKLGLHTVRAITSYSNSAQPDSTASTTIDILMEEGKGRGGVMVEKPSIIVEYIEIIKEEVIEKVPLWFWFIIIALVLIALLQRGIIQPTISYVVSAWGIILIVIIILLILFLLWCFGII